MRPAEDRSSKALSPEAPIAARVSGGRRAPFPGGRPTPTALNVPYRDTREFRLGRSPAIKQRIVPGAWASTF